jgi:hypothetical protein
MKFFKGQPAEEVLGGTSPLQLLVLLGGSPRAGVRIIKVSLNPEFCSVLFCFASGDL